MRRAFALAAIAASLALSACGSSGTGGGGSSASPPDTSSPAPNSAAMSTSGPSVSGTITVLAAASLTETFDAIAKQFEAEHPDAKIVFSYGASSDLATEIQNGNPADVFASASTKTMDQVGDAATQPTDFATNTMEIAVPPGNPKKITKVADLAKSGVSVAVCDFEVPCGVVAKQVFDNAKVTVNPTAREQDVKSTLAVVESNEVDAGVVYVTDVKAAGSKVDGVTIPASINATTTYPISVLKDSKNEALAQAFVAYVLSSAGQQVLRDAAFAPA